MADNWRLKPQPDSAVLSEYRGLHSLLGTLLWQRGVPPMRVEAFLSPSYESLGEPWIFRDMHKAVDRIWHAIDRHEKILVYADYDADAVTASAVLQQMFKFLGVEVASYIPDRFSEGYGLNSTAFQSFGLQGVSLVITVDCGINSRDEALVCQKLGIDLIITDHHELIGDLPEAYAIINPKVPGELYPDSQLTGVGVAYKLATAILQNKDKVVSIKGSADGFVANWDKWLLDLVAIGTVADCHSLLGENRILVHYGLKVLAKTKWPGLRQLMNTAGVNLQELSVYTLGFLLAPRINAAGRLEHANIALDTLLTEYEEEAVRLASLLDGINIRRQEMTARIISEAKEQAMLFQADKILVLASKQWHKGLVGIVAGRLAFELGKPVIVLEMGEEVATGSARTYGNFNVVEALQSCRELLIKFGGHKQAAGLTLKNVSLEEFRGRLSTFADKHGAELAETPVLEIDAKLEASKVDLDLYDLLNELEPFGAENPRPVFLISELTITRLKKVGNGGSHAQIVFSHSQGVMAGVAFQKGYVCDTFKVGEEVNAVVELMVDTWNGVRKIKLKVLAMQKEN